MSTKPATLPISPLVSIQDWSKGRPSWQRDALRRIVTQGKLGDLDLRELECLCRQSHDALEPAEDRVEAVLLNADHLPPGTQAGGGVSLVALANLSNVNRLLGDQKLTFSPGPKLTIVYGKNGAGKSGYARVIKKACRCRGQAQPILPDVLADLENAPTAARADFVIEENGREHRIEWASDACPDERLGRIFVFDTDSAEHYIQESEGTAFTPFGLDVLEHLALACNALKDRISQRRRELEARAQQLKEETAAIPRSTQVGQWIDALSPSTEPTELETVAAWSETDTQQLDQLNQMLNTDPVQRAQRARQAADRLLALRDRLKTQLNALNAEAFDTIRRAVEQVEEASNAARVFTLECFDGTYLPGTGGPLWAKLWEAAREFAAQPRPTPSPGSDLQLQAEERCVFCQSVLDEAATARLQHFDAYMASEASRQLAAARARVEALREPLRLLPSLVEEWARLKEDPILAGQPNLVPALDALLPDLDAWREAALKLEWASAPPLEPSPALEAIEQAVSNLGAEVARAEQEADPKARELREQARAELEARSWLFAHKSRVLALIEVLQKLAALEKCLGETNTNAISRKNKELVELHVTEAFRERFAEEVAFLGLARVQVALHGKGEKGTTRYSLRVTPTSKHPLSHVASEGERRCLALALFLAELAQTSDQSALVFDDPVSSLDHERRTRIAERIAREAQSRQVIVFTHDLSLMCDLKFYAATHGVQVLNQHIDRSGGAPGRCRDGLPWNAQSHKEMMKSLKDRCKRAGLTWETEAEEEYQQQALHLTSDIRAAAERIVEEVLFNGVVRRHDSQITMGKLEYVAEMEKSDYHGVLSVWRECSRMTPAHASPRADSEAAPLPEQLLGLVGRLEEVVQRVRERQKGAQASPSESVVAFKVRN